MPVAAATLKTFHVLHPLAFPLEPENLLLIFVEFEEFHLHRTVVGCFVHSGVLLEARNLAVFGMVLADFMQRDMLGDKDCERSDQHRLFHLSCENLCRTSEIASPIPGISPGTSFSVRDGDSEI